MADVKISGLPASTTPLAGTEVLPVVQGGATKQVSVANLTAGRAVSAASLALTTTPLPATSGGTGTSTALTTGSVVFASASGVYAQDNANFFWDDTNNRLGIRTGAPDTPIQIGGGVSGSNATFPGVLQINEAPNALQSTGGLEYKTSAFASGYGWKISSIDSGGVQLVIGTRQNSASWTEVARFTSGNNFSVANGNVVIATSGKGIDFSATAGTGTSELLADYEEGTFTPGIAFNNAAVDVTYSTQDGIYTKVGRCVTFTVNIVLTNKGSSTGNMTVTGLPFTSIATHAYGTSFADWYDFNFAAINPIYAKINPTNTNVSMFRQVSAGTVQAITDAQVLNSTQLKMSGFYFV
jgi:hypothetical protein